MNAHKFLLPFIAATLIGSPVPLYGATALGLIGNGFVKFDTESPGVITDTVLFSSLIGGDGIVDFDYRPADGLLYGMATSGRLYTIDTTTGAALVKSELGVVGQPGGFPTAVTDVDFNPTANRLRVFTVGDNNFRLTPESSDPATGISSDGILAYQSGDENDGQSPNLRASAYTNNIIGGVGGTTLFSLDTDLDVLTVHSSAVGQAGTFSLLGTVGLLNINGLGLDFSNDSGFDILTTGGINLGYVTTNNTLYEVDLVTADLVPLGTIGGPASGFEISSLAVVANPIPEPAALAMACLSMLMVVRRRR